MASAKKVLAPVDTDVVVPASVRAAAAAADALHKQYYPDAPMAEPAAPVEPVVVPLAAEPAPVEPVVAPAEPVAVVTPVGNENALAPVSDQTWEHKFNSMKGRYERADRENKALAERAHGLEQVLATMAVTAPIPAAAAVEPATASAITAAERETYGDEFIAMASKIANEQWSPKVNSLEAELKILRERLEGVGAYVGQNERDRMHSQLTDKVPNWLEVNKSQEFMDWLALPDRYTGAIKNDILQAAYAANDTPRVLAFFQGFLEEAAPAPRNELPAPAPAAVKVPLETFAAPGRAKTAAAQPAPAEKPILTRADITQFYVDVSNKKYVGREDEKARLDQMIIEAGREGRIR